MIRRISPKVTISSLAFIIVASILCFALSGLCIPQSSFDTASWRKNSHENLYPEICKELAHANKNDVLRLLGEPDKQWDAGTGMWGPYPEHWCYILDCPRDNSGHVDNGYTWNELEISFASGAIKKIEIRGHCY